MAMGVGLYILGFGISGVGVWVCILALFLITNNEEAK